MAMTAATTVLSALLGGAMALPPGFERTTIVAPLVEPTAIEFLPDGRMLIGQRDGTIRQYANGSLLPAPLVQIPCDIEGGERGLVGLAVDPQFAANGLIYVYYTTTEPRNRVGRFTIVGASASASLASEQLIWQNSQPAALWHHGGGIAIHPGDNRLYISTGDQFVAPNAQNLGNEHGKLLRVALDGSIPADNPFIGVAGAAPTIYAYGLRNPFRLVIDRLGGSVWIGDVGGNASQSWEELNLAAPGANFGASMQEGAMCFVPSCAGIVGPRYTYQHNNPAYYSGQPQASITLGAVYRASQFPIENCGSMFIGDYANRWIRRLVFDTRGQVVADPVFLAAPEAGTIVDLEIGPDGALYYLTHGVPWTGVPDLGAVHRIAYTGPIFNADLSGDCRVNGIDLAALLAQWLGSSAYSPCPPYRPADLNHDCRVNGIDLAMLLAAWNP